MTKTFQDEVIVNSLYLKKNFIYFISVMSWQPEVAVNYSCLFKKKRSNVNWNQRYICEIPFYFIDIIIIDKMIWLGTIMTLDSRHKLDLDLKKFKIFFNLC